jgi:hypothetical protein
MMVAGRDQTCPSARTSPAQASRAGGPLLPKMVREQPGEHRRHVRHDHDRYRQVAGSSGISFASVRAAGQTPIAIVDALRRTERRATVAAAPGATSGAAGNGSAVAARKAPASISSSRTLQRARDVLRMARR